MKESKLYKVINHQAHCEVCCHYCQIEENKFGQCGNRYFHEGKLFSLAYGRPVSLGVDPIEKKPFYHFLPGSLAYSLGTMGCNFHCANCQNWEISQSVTDPDNLPQYISPEKIIERAKQNHCHSIAYTYNEPTIFLEYARDIMKLARKSNLKNVWVSNGYLSPASREEILPYLDAINIDLKFFQDDLYQKICGARLRPVLENITFFHQAKIHLELTTLLISELIDSEQINQMINFIKNLDTAVPWHISRFFPEVSWQLEAQIATPAITLENAYWQAKKSGLKYVYLGNYDNLQYNSTCCPTCQRLIIQRNGYDIQHWDQDGFCPQCKTNLNLILD